MPVLGTPKPAQANPGATSATVPAGVMMVGGPAWQDMQSSKETSEAAMVLARRDWPAPSLPKWQFSQFSM